MYLAYGDNEIDNEIDQEYDKTVLSDCVVYTDDIGFLCTLTFATLENRPLSAIMCFLHYATMSL